MSPHKLLLEYGQIIDAERLQIGTMRAALEDVLALLRYRRAGQPGYHTVDGLAVDRVLATIGDALGGKS